MLDGPCMLMLTGPNYSGKSVLLKQVWYFGDILKILLMADLGCSDSLYGSYRKVFTLADVPPSIDS